MGVQGDGRVVGRAPPPVQPGGQRAEREHGGLDQERLRGGGRHRQVLGEYSMC